MSHDLDEDIGFDKASQERVAKLASRTPHLGGISERRYERIRTEILYHDVVAMHEDINIPRNGAIRCPFHGRDSTASFYVYDRSNSGFCYGCPDGDKYWDSIKYIARKFEYSRRKSVLYLEKEFGLPPLEDDPAEEDEEKEAPPVEIDPRFFKKDYVTRARSMIKRVQGADRLELSKQLIGRYFSALSSKDPMPLAEIIGRTRVRQIVSEVANRSTDE